MAIATLKANELIDKFLADANTMLALYVDENTEVSGGGYKRMPITFLKALNGQSTNVNVVEFPQATTAWGTVRYACVVVNDEVVYRNALTVAQPVGTGNTFIVPENYFIVRMKGLM